MLNRGFINKTIIVLLILILTLSVIFVFRNKKEVKAVPLDGNITLGIGESAKFESFILTFNDFLNDYRCPIDVECIEAGAVNTNVTFSDGVKTETKNMPSDEVPQVFGDYKISIIGVLPPLKSNAVIPKNEYKIIFQIER